MSSAGGKGARALVPWTAAASQPFQDVDVTIEGCLAAFARAHCIERESLIILPFSRLRDFHPREHFGTQTMSAFCLQIETEVVTVSRMQSLTEEAR